MPYYHLVLWANRHRQANCGYSFHCQYPYVGESRDIYFYSQRRLDDINIDTVFCSIDLQEIEIDDQFHKDSEDRGDIHLVGDKYHRLTDEEWDKMKSRLDRILGDDNYRHEYISLDDIEDVVLDHFMEKLKAYYKTEDPSDACNAYSTFCQLTQP